MNGDGWGSPSRRSNVQIATRKRTTPRSSWTSRTARVWQPHRASFPCSVRRLSPSLSVIPPSSPSRADVSEGCDGNSICLSLTPSPAKACGGATLLPISISLALARRGTKRRRRRQMKYFIQKTPPPPPLRSLPCPKPTLCIITRRARSRRRRLFLMRGMQSGIDCRCLNVPSFERGERERRE